jgi:hypothetical protein
VVPRSRKKLNASRVFAGNSIRVWSRFQANC